MANKTQNNRINCELHKSNKEMKDKRHGKKKKKKEDKRHGWTSAGAIVVGPLTYTHT